MIQFHVFPGGKKRIVTFSYDDGRGDDERLRSLFDLYGVKGTFHLNGSNYTHLTETQLEAIRKRYEGHEIACHTFQHGWPERMPPISVVNEVIQDRCILERITNYAVVGMSYPSGSYSEQSIAAMKSCGIVYGRTTGDTLQFQLPKDFMTWHPTCHHKRAMPLIDEFLENLDSPWVGPLLYIWGHSHEFTDDEAWAYMESIIKKIAGNKKIWYATNIEIHDYLTAQRRLRISADERLFYNPSNIPIWVEKDKKDILCIMPGETLVYNG